MSPSRLLVPLLAAFLVLPTLASDLVGAAGFDRLSDELSAVGAAEAAFIRRSKLKKRRTSGYRVVVVVGDDAVTDEVAAVDVVIPHVPGAPVPSGGTTVCDGDGTCETQVTLDLKVVKGNGNKRFVFNQLEFSDDAVNFSYPVTSTMKDAADQPLGSPVTSVIEVEDDGDSRVRSVVIRQLDETNFLLKALVVGDFAGEVAEVWICITDYEGPDPEPDECFDLANPEVDGGKRVFSTETMSFSNPALAVDEVYTMTVELRGANHELIGASVMEVVVEGFDEALIVQLQAELAAHQGFVQAVLGLVDQAELDLAEVADAIAALGIVPEADPNAPASQVANHPETFNVLLHEMRGLALEVTLD